MAKNSRVYPAQNTRARYMEIIGGDTPSVALVTNFVDSFGPSRQPGLQEEQAKRIASTIARSPFSKGNDLIVVEGLIGEEMDYRTADFDTSASELVKGLEAVGGTELASRFEAPGVALVDELARLDREIITEQVDYYRNKYAGLEIGYIGVVSTVQLGGLGFQVNLFDSRDTASDYERLANGQVLLPTPLPHDVGKWDVVPQE